MSRGSVPVGNVALYREQFYSETLILFSLFAVFLVRYYLGRSVGKIIQI